MKRVSIPLCVVLALFLTGCSGCEEGGGVVGPPVLTEDSEFIVSFPGQSDASLQKCKKDPDSCPGLNISQVKGDYFCYTDALLVVQYESSETVPSCKNGRRQSLDRHLLQRAKVIEVLQGNGIEKGSTIEFIPTELQLEFLHIEKGAYAIVKLLHDETRNIWFRKGNLMLSLDGKPYEDESWDERGRPSDIGYFFLDFSLFPNTLRKLRPFIKESLANCPFKSQELLTRHRNIIFNIFNMPSNFIGESCRTVH